MVGLKNQIRTFGSNIRGNISIVLGLSLVSLIGVTGLAVDYSRVTQTKAEIFAAADAAALAGARTTGTVAERNAAAKAVFDSNIKNLKEIGTVTYSPENITQEGANYGYRVAATVDVKTSFGGMFGVDTISSSVLAEAIGVISSRTEIALVLDTTYSMTGWKINTLRKASVDLVDNLSKLNKKADQLKFSIIPFSEYVNVGMSNRKKPWINVPDDYQDPSTKVCWNEAPVTGKSNCRMVTQPAQPGTPAGTCYNDGVPYSCGGSSPQASYQYETCDYTYGPSVEKCTMQEGAWHRWYGCVGSRANPLDTRDDNYGTRIPGLLDQSCGTPLMELTSDFSALKNTLNGLTPNGETFIPAGVLWGWASLTAQVPFDAGTNTSSDPVRKYMVLMTDGLNTRSPSYPRHDGTNGAQSNQLTKQICANIAADKTNNIMMFTVAFDVTDSTTKQILKDCATNTKGQFFDARNADQFLTAFSKIGSIIAELRLSK